MQRFEQHLGASCHFIEEEPINKHCLWSFADELTMSVISRESLSFSKNPQQLPRSVNIESFHFHSSCLKRAQPGYTDPEREKDSLSMTLKF